MLATQTERLNFSNVKNRPDYPDFLDIQIQSFQDFFQLETKSDEREAEGLYKTFMENFPITDTRNQFVLEFLDYFVDPPRYSIQECIERGLTYSVPLKARLKLYCTDPEHEDFETIVQDVYLGTIPYMTPSGTFCINGAERVVVSQLHRSPGVFFGQSFHANGTKLYSARVIPFKGSWIEFATDINSVMYAYIDRKKKLPVTTLFRAIGFERDKDILEIFDLAEEVKVSKTGLKKVLGRKLAARVLNTWYEDFVDEDTGEVVSIERNEIVLDRDTELDKDHIEEILETGTKTILLHKEDNSTGDYAIIHNTLQKDPTNSEKEAVEHIYRQLRNAEPPDEETARGIIDKLFFSDQRYSLGEVGRYRMNKKLGLDVAMDKQVLTKEDIITIVKYLIELINSKAEIDDIDHLSNRRVRTVGEQLSQQFGVGLARMARTIRERMNVRDNEVFTPIDLINAKTLSSVINSFFGTNQLSQFMDQTNPLAEITHKRRLSALGPGGLSRERAGFEVRDVHYTHYGRLCPIETPEGPNIGLINSLSTHAIVNNLGFIESPYRIIDKKNKNYTITKKIKFLSPDEEDRANIAQSTELCKNNKFLNKTINSRNGDNFPTIKPNQVDYMDVSPRQLVSVSASLIPFLENDDANRALMGSNMMRQAVPLIKPESPLVGTGIERDVALDSGVTIIARIDGVVDKIDGKRIVVKAFEKDLSKSGVDIYNLLKFQKSNQNTTINQKPLVKVGDIIKKGDIIADGPSTKLGELALGKNITVAFMPWLGYNFEDSILISERCVTDDVFTSVHIEEYELMTRDTKLGTEEITRDIPNISEESLRNLDESGIVYVGAEVKAGDILVGKVTPKGDSISNPEEKLLRSIFGEKATDVRDSSLKMPPGSNGTVIDVRVFNRQGIEKDERSTAIERSEIESVQEDALAEEEILERNIKIRAQEMIKGKKLNNDFKKLKAQTKLTPKNLDETNLNNIWKLQFVEQKTNDDLKILKEQYTNVKKDIKDRFEDKVEKIRQGDILLPNVLKMVKVFVAVKRPLKPGDKMAGRHGNKGVISKIVPVEDMPYMKNGKPVDVVLNPLGVPSRMNVGQILETHLGWACAEMGDKINQIIKQHNDIRKRDELVHNILKKVYGDDAYEKKIKPLKDKEFEDLIINLSSGVPVSTPVFDGASVDDVTELLKLAELPSSGQTTLWDGRTGEQFDRKVTVGIIYMLKLHHLVEDKIHARSTGPYSLVTQQPLGGKAQLGGQRFGEMEVWALEAYGASYTLQEILTVKSDDVAGRTKVYETIVKGDDKFESGVPESFNVLINEIKSLGLNIDLN